MATQAASQRRVAVVTGAGSGVGRHSALALLNDGYCVALLGRRLAALEETAALADSGSRSLVVSTDVASESSVRSAFERTLSQFGRVDLLFNNAGGNAPPIPLDELTLEQWEGVVDVNLTGMF
ncbi:MAG: SDR family NAD(P)-dependent oxidoreductase, partial [Bryobacterales bacterium]|nr:SDR family NAD(P)-dependent oxidoreductase [Bryobacterales bacterium]